MQLGGEKGEKMGTILLIFSQTSHEQISSSYPLLSFTINA